MQMAANNLTNQPRPRIIAAWVDGGIASQNDHRAMKQRFTQLSSFIEEWHFFETPEQLDRFLDDNLKTQIFLISSGYLGQKIVPKIHTYANIHSIYIFCGNVNEHRHLKDDYDKVKDVMNLEDDLYERIADNLSLLLIDIGESCIRSQDRGLARNYLEEALRLMRDTLRFGNDHGRIRKAKELLESLDYME